MRFLFLLLLAMLHESAIGQMSISNLNVSNSCMDSYFYLRFTLTGGQAPYSLVLTSGPGTNAGTYQTQIGQSGAHVLPLGGINIWYPTTTLVITDAQGVTASAWTYGDFYMVATPQVQLSYRCNGGADLLWNGSYDAFIFGPTPFCGPFTYVLSDGNNAVLASGDLAAHWVQETSGYWRYGQALTPGDYRVRIIPASPECPSDWYHYCPLSTHVTVAAPSPAGPGITLRALLGGPGATGATPLMPDGLRSAGLIPLTEPFSA